MRILVDGDACPQKEDIAKIAKEHHIPVIMYMDYAHLSDYHDYEVRLCEIGRDSVDKVLTHEVKQGDLVITQDYGLASLVLSRDAHVLHVSGKVIDEDNIDGLLMGRYEGYKERRRDKHIKGPKKRTKMDQDYFLKQLQLLIQQYEGR